MEFHQHLLGVREGQRGVAPAPGVENCRRRGFSLKTGAGEEDSTRKKKALLKGMKKERRKNKTTDDEEGKKEIAEKRGGE